MAEKKEKVFLVTPKAKCIWPKLKEPQLNFKGDKYEYSVALLFPPDEIKALPFKETLDSMVRESVEQARTMIKNPLSREKVHPVAWFRPQVNKQYEKTGLMEMRFKTAADIEDKGTGEKKRIKIPIYDTSKRLIESVPDIANDSVLKVAFNPMPYYVESSGEAGIVLYLNAVQLIELIEYKGMREDGGFYGFNEEEGSYAAPNANEHVPASSSLIEDEINRMQGITAIQHLNNQWQKLICSELWNTLSIDEKEVLEAAKNDRAQKIQNDDIPF